MLYNGVAQLLRHTTKLSDFNCMIYTFESGVWRSQKCGESFKFARVFAQTEAVSLRHTIMTYTFEF